MKRKNIIVVAIIAVVICVNLFSDPKTKFADIKLFDLNLMLKASAEYIEGDTLDPDDPINGPIFIPDSIFDPNNPSHYDPDYWNE